MSNDVDGERWRIAALVGFFGGLGGLTAWVWSITVGTPLEFGRASAVTINVFLGVVAGFVGIYAVKLDSSRALMHSLALALLCGFAWKPLLEAGQQLVITHVQEADVAEKIETVRQDIAQLHQANPETAPILIDQLQSDSEELMNAAVTIRNPELRAQTRQVVTDLVPALSGAADVAPEASARALGSVGAAALREGRAAVANAAVRALLNLAENPQAEVGTSSEASNSLLRLSSAARAEDHEDQAEALRQQSLEIVRRAERRAISERNPEAVKELRERSFVARELPPPERATP